MITTHLALFSFFNGMVVASAQRAASGVRVSRAKRTVNLSDLSENTDRNRASEFIKQQLALDRARAAQEQETRTKQRKGKSRAKGEQERLAAVALQNMEIERQQKLLEQTNNDILAVIMMSAQ